jgi:hypothetical protein
MVADQYNAMNRAKVAYLDNHYLDSGSSGSPAGLYVTGYEPLRVGSGVGMYKKTRDCPTGSGQLCTCENREFKRAVGGNAGLNPNVRASLALGAGIKGNRIQRHGTLEQDFSMLARGEASGCGSCGGDLMDYYNKAKKAVEVGKKIYDVGKKAYDVGKEGYEVYKQVRGKGSARGVARGPAGRKPRLVKSGKGSARGSANGEASGEARGGDLMDYYNKAKKAVEIGKKVYDVGKKAYDVGKEGYEVYKQVRGKGSARGEARGSANGSANGKKPNARAMIVKKIMNEKGLKLIEASKYVKAHGLY